MKKSFWIIGLLIIIAASFFVWFYIFKPNDKNEKNIQTAEVVRRDIGSTVLAIGIIKPQVGAEVKLYLAATIRYSRKCVQNFRSPVKTG
jgi:multidrug efflux pump subunit AcrA (membrane-fusion protein)